MHILARASVCSAANFTHEKEKRKSQLRESKLKDSRLNLGGNPLNAPLLQEDHEENRPSMSDEVFDSTTSEDVKRDRLMSWEMNNNATAANRRMVASDRVTQGSHNAEKHCLSFVDMEYDFPKVIPLSPPPHHPPPRSLSNDRDNLLTLSRPLPSAVRPNREDQAHPRGARDVARSDPLHEYVPPGDLR
jgi:hypothetical protein